MRPVVRVNRRSKTVAADTAGVARVEAYPDRARNEIYNLLFADDVDALKPATPKADLAAVATDEDAESRVRVVAFRRLRAGGKAPPGDPPLLGMIVEIALDEGLDTLAAYADGRIRYINHAGGMSIVEDGTAAARAGRRPAAGVAVGRRQDRAVGRAIGCRLRLTGQARLTFLVGGDIYFGQAPFEALAGDPMAGPVLNTATALLSALVALQGEGN